MKIEKTEPVEGAKRMYIPFKITTKCPECGAEVVENLDGNKPHGHYFSYLMLGGGPFDHPIYCTECDHEIPCQLELVLDLKQIGEEHELVGNGLMCEMCGSDLVARALDDNTVGLVCPICSPKVPLNTLTYGGGS